MAEDADMRNELEEMQRRADQLADEVRPVAKTGNLGLGLVWNTLPEIGAELPKDF